MLHSFDELLKSAVFFSKNEQTFVHKSFLLYICTTDNGFDSKLYTQ